MHRSILASTFVLVTALALGCAPAPNVETPALVNLAVAGTQPSEWVNVPVAGGTTFAVMPLSQPGAVLRLTLDAPFPGQLVVMAVDPASGTTVPLPPVFGTQEGPASGFHHVDAIDTRATPKRWTITIRPPDAFATLSTLRISIAHKDGPVQSDPLVVTLDGARQS